MLKPKSVTGSRLIGHTHKKGISIERFPIADFFFYDRNAMQERA